MRKWGGKGKWYRERLQKTRGEEEIREEEGGGRKNWREVKRREMHQ